MKWQTYFLRTDHFLAYHFKKIINQIQKIMVTTVTTEGSLLYKKPTYTVKPD